MWGSVSTNRGSGRRRDLLLLVKVLSIFIVAAAVLKYLGIVPEGVLSPAAEVIASIIGGLPPAIGDAITAVAVTLIGVLNFVFGLVILLIELTLVGFLLAGTVWLSGFYWKSRKDTLRDAFRAELNQMDRHFEASTKESEEPFYTPSHVPVYHAYVGKLHRLNPKERMRIVAFYTKILNDSRIESRNRRIALAKERQELVDLLKESSNRSVLDELKALDSTTPTGKTGSKAGTTIKRER